MDSIIDFIKKEPKKEKSKVSTLKKKKKISIGQILAAATHKKEKLDFNDSIVKSSYDQFMVNRWLSMDDSLIFLAEVLNTMHNLTDEQHFNMISSALPKEKFYFSYIKGGKDLTEKDKRYISDYFGIGVTDTEIYINTLDDDEIDDILSKYKYGKNKMVEL